MELKALIALGIFLGACSGTPKEKASKEKELDQKTAENAQEAAKFDNAATGFLASVDGRKAYLSPAPVSYGSANSLCVDTLGGRLPNADEAEAAKKLYVINEDVHIAHIEPDFEDNLLKALCIFEPAAEGAK